MLVWYNAAKVQNWIHKYLKCPLPAVLPDPPLPQKRAYLFYPWMDGQSVSHCTGSKGSIHDLKPSLIQDPFISFWYFVLLPSIACLCCRSSGLRWYLCMWVAAGSIGGWPGTEHWRVLPGCSLCCRRSAPRHCSWSHHRWCGRIWGCRGGHMWQLTWHMSSRDMSGRQRKTENSRWNT